jgi:hypothetical protein
MNSLNITRKIVAVIFFGMAMALGVVAAKPKLVSTSVLNFSHASVKHMTEAQKRTLLDSYNSGHPVSVDSNVCCCQPGYRVYDNSHQRCSQDGKLYDK